MDYDFKNQTVITLYGEDVSGLEAKLPKPHHKTVSGETIHELMYSPALDENILTYFVKAMAEINDPLNYTILQMTLKKEPKPKKPNWKRKQELFAFIHKLINEAAEDNE